MPIDIYTAGFGQEWFIEPGREPGLVEGWWLDEAAREG